MSVLEALELDRWSGKFPTDDCARAVDALESGKVVFLPRLAFQLQPHEHQFLTPSCSDGKSKNIAFDPQTGSSHGSSLPEGSREQLKEMMARFSSQSTALVRTLFVDYAADLQIGRTSYRPLEAHDRPSSYRKDDQRLHADAFPSSPTRGRRILRVFSNINPDGVPRVWLIGEPFQEYARRFLPQVGRQWPGSAWALQRLGITKGRRSAYDHIMLQLHDRGKADLEYQRQGPRTEVRFPAGSTWIVYTDCALHAALSGQYLLEQTFYLNFAAMRYPERSPLRTLERLTGRPLI